MGLVFRGSCELEPGICPETRRYLHWKTIRSVLGHRCSQAQREILWYFSEHNKQAGVVVGDTPAGPWKDPLGKPLLPSELTPIHEYDMAVFQDDDGEYYILYGPYDYAGTVMTAESFAPGYDTPTWPHGPLQGRHGSFFEWNNQWYFAYCDISQTGNRRFRDSFISYVHYKANGDIAPVRVDGIGVGQYDATKGVIEAEDYFKSVGISKKESPEGGFVLDDIESGDYLVYPNIKGLTGKRNIEITMMANKRTTLEIHQDSPEGPLLGKCKISAMTASVFEKIVCKLPEHEEKESLCFVFKGKGKQLCQIDSFSVH